MILDYDGIHKGVTLLSSDSRIGFLNRTVIAVTKIGCDKSVMVDARQRSCRTFETLVLAGRVARELLTEKVYLHNTQTVLNGHRRHWLVDGRRIVVVLLIHGVVL